MREISGSVTNRFKPSPALQARPPCTGEGQLGLRNYVNSRGSLIRDAPRIRRTKLPHVTAHPPRTWDDQAVPRGSWRNATRIKYRSYSNARRELSLFLKYLVYSVHNEIFMEFARAKQMEWRMYIKLTKPNLRSSRTPYGSRFPAMIDIASEMHSELAENRVNLMWK